MTQLEKLIARARLAMNVLLASSLVGFWAGITSGTSSEDLEHRLTLLTDSVDKLTADVGLQEEIPPYVQNWLRIEAFELARRDDEALENASPNTATAIGRERALNHQEALHRRMLETDLRDQLRGAPVRRADTEKFALWLDQLQEYADWRDRLDAARQLLGNTEPVTGLSLADLQNIAPALTPPEFLANASSQYPYFELEREQYIDTGETNAASPAMGELASAIPEARRVQQLITEFENRYSAAGIGYEDSALKLAELGEEQVKIPVVDLQFSAPVAVLLIGSGSCVVLLNLVSIGFTINCVVEDADSKEGVDWIFFHRCRIGFWLGSVWLHLPSFVLLTFAWRMLLRKELYMVAFTSAILGAVLWLGHTVVEQMRTARAVLLSQHDSVEKAHRAG